MTPQDEADFLGHLKYELDALYVLTEMIQSLKFMQFPLDSFLLECCLTHFRVVWDFFYGDDSHALTVRAFLSDEKVRATRPKQPKRLKDIRYWVNSTVVHLGLNRIKPERKVKEPRMEDIAEIRLHLENLFTGFLAALDERQKAAFVNPLAHKFQNYKTLRIPASPPL